MQQPPEIEPIPILVRTEEISDRPPGGEEIAVAVRTLCSGQVGGNFRDMGRTPEYVACISNTEEVPCHTKVG